MKNLFVILFMILTISCEKVIDMNIPDKGRRPVVNCVFGDSNYVYMTIHRSKHILDNSYDFSVISGAGIIITNAGTNHSDTLFETSTPGNYKSLQALTSPGTYNLKVMADGRTIESSTIIPEKAQIISIDTSSFSVDNEDMYRMDIRFSDAGPGDDYFMIGVKRVSSIGDKYNISLFSSDLIITTYYKDYLLFNDDLFNNKEKTLRVEMQKSNLYTEYDSLDLTIELFSLSYDAYMYFATSQEQMYAGGPFSEPVVVYNNINEGYGIFAGYSISKNIIRVPRYDTQWTE